MQQRAAPAATEVTVANTGQTFSCPEGELILDAGLEAGIGLPHNCRGGACGTCTVQIMDGEVQHIDGRVLAPRPAREGQEARGRWVRACQVLPHADCTIEVEPRSLAPDFASSG